MLTATSIKKSCKLTALHRLIGIIAVLLRLLISILLSGQAKLSFDLHLIDYSDRLCTFTWRIEFECYIIFFKDMNDAK